MFSLFISFDFLISYLNQFFFLFLLFFLMLSYFINFYMFLTNLLFNVMKLFFFEIKLTTKMKLNFNVIIYLSMFMMLLMINLFGMFPFFFTLSSQLNFCFFFSLLFWLIVMMNNLFSNYKNFLPHLVPSGSPIILSQFMIIIETISQLIRPLTLGVRLMANMTAGHLIMILCSFPIFVFNMVTLPLLMLMILEFMVAMIQAYVFVTLMSMYLGEFNT